jgi:ABC-2 type transport system ATP-binding protein
VKRSEIEPDKKFGKLSKGVQRRLAFALAATGSQLPSRSRPPAWTGDAGGYLVLRAGWRQDSCIRANHVMEEVRRVADYVVFLLDGDFLGLHEKDALHEQRKTIWVDREPVGDVAGAVEVEGGSPKHIVSHSPRETGEAPSAENIRIIRSGTLDPEEILSHLMRRSKEGRAA